jgi:hypothetical protein
MKWCGVRFSVPFFTKFQIDLRISLGDRLFKTDRCYPVFYRQYHNFGPKFTRPSRLSQYRTQLFNCDNLSGFADFRPDLNGGLWLAPFVPCRILQRSGLKVFRITHSLMARIILLKRPNQQFSNNR